MTQTQRPLLGSVPRWLALFVAAALMLALAPVLTGTASARPGEIEIDRGDGLIPSARFAGEDRFDTAELIATDETEFAADFEGDTVILARADLFPDALAGSLPGGVEDAPIVLTTSNTDEDNGDLNEDTMEALEEYEDRGLERVLILGEEAAINENVVEAVEREFPGVETERFGGFNRFETAAILAENFADFGVMETRTAIVADGGDFPDALVSGAISAAAGIPILLTGDPPPGDPVLDPFTAEQLEEMDIEDVIIAGGTDAVSAEAEDAIEEITGEGSARRVNGVDRFETAVEFAELGTDEFGFGTDHANLATAEKFPDSLALGPHAGMDVGGGGDEDDDLDIGDDDGNPAPILLTASGTSETQNQLSGQTAAYFESISSCEFESLHVAGGQEAIRETVEQQAREILSQQGEACDIDLTPETATNLVGESHTVTAQLVDNGERDVAQAGVEVEFTVEPDETGTAMVDETNTAMPSETTTVTGDDGSADFTFTSDQPGDFTITAEFTNADGETRTATATKRFVLPDNLFGVTGTPFGGVGGLGLMNPELVEFDEDGNETDRTELTGGEDGDVVVGADIRSSTGLLYILTDSGDLFTVGDDGELEDRGNIQDFGMGMPNDFDLENGVGFDFNPIGPNALRIVLPDDTNIRVAFDENGDIANVIDEGEDNMEDGGDIEYASGDENEGENPAVTAAGYRNNTELGSGETATATELYVIDTDLDVLATQMPANAGTLMTDGPLGLDASEVNGFDIVSDEQNELVRAGDDAAFALLTADGDQALYRIDLDSGEARFASELSGEEFVGFYIGAGSGS